MAYYDSTKMRRGAEDIRAELKNYNAAKTAIDNIVNTLKENWDDENHREYVRKYNNEAKVSAENVQKLMNTFADTLETAADNWEKVKNTTESGMR